VSIWDVLALGAAFLVGFVAGIKWLTRRLFRYESPFGRRSHPGTQRGSGDGRSGERVPRRPMPSTPHSSVAIDPPEGNRT